MRTARVRRILACALAPALFTAAIALPAAAQAAAPTTTATLTPVANGAGFSKANTSVQLTATPAPPCTAALLGHCIASTTYVETGAQNSGPTSATFNGQPGNRMTNVLPTITTEGQTTVQYFSTNNNGEAEATKQVVVSLDKTLPTVAIARTGPSTATITAADPTSNGYASGLKVITYRRSNNGGPFGVAQVTAAPPNTVVVPLFPTGTTTIEFTSTDKADNDSTLGPETYNADTTPPVVTITRAGTSTGPIIGPGGFAYYKANVNVTVGATDASGVASRSCSFDGGAPSVLPGGGPSLYASFGIEGKRTVSCTATDNAGNTSVAVVNQFVIDDTRPTTTLTKSPNTFASNGPVTVTCTGTDPNQGAGPLNAPGVGIATTTVQGTGAQPFGPSTTAANPRNVVISTPGITTVTCFATDKLGNQSTPTQSITVRIDNTPPTVSVNETFVFLDGSPNQTITGSAFDNAGVAKVEVRIDGTNTPFSQTYTANCPLCSPTGTATAVDWSLNLSALGLPINNYQATVIATDTAGNQSTAPTTVTIVKSF